ncbi:MAG: STAS/SEC14 domain-containing protein [Oceanospirillaceae bacterium]|nr:STAS/SEC14 domain-containing protein [Oceanospirillaceae bacterium]
MLYVLPDSAGDMLMLQGNGNLSQKDYTDVFLAQIEKQLKPGSTLRVLLYLDHDFSHFDEDSNWNAQLLFKASGTDIARMAIISDGSGNDLCSSFNTAEVQHFATAEFLKAMHWCDEPLN